MRRQLTSSGELWNPDKLFADPHDSQHINGGEGSISYECANPNCSSCGHEFVYPLHYYKDGYLLPRTHWVCKQCYEPYKMESIL